MSEFKVTWDELDLALQGGAPILSYILDYSYDGGSTWCMVAYENEYCTISHGHFGDVGSRRYFVRAESSCLHHTALLGLSMLH